MFPRRRVFRLFILSAAFAAFGVSAALGAAPTPSPSLSVIFERHREAMGRLPTLVAHWSGTIIDNGQPAKYDIVSARDGRFRRTYTLPLTQLVEGSNLYQDWVQDENGNVQTFAAQRHQSMDSRLVRLNDLRFEPHSSSLSGTTTIDGKKVYRVSLGTESGAALVYFDVVTSLVDGADIGSETVRYRAYKHFDGVAVPTEIDETDPDDNLKITVDSVSFVSESRSEFDPPAQRRPAFPAGVNHITMSFDSPRGLIVCAAKINGRTARFILDSGSTTSIIDSDLAKQLNLATGGVSHVEGAALMTGTLARVDTLNLGGIEFAPFFMQAVPLRLPSRLAHDGIDGVLGYDVIAPLVVRIAYARGEIQLIDPASFSYTGTGAVLSMDTSKRIPSIAATVGSTDKGSFTVDTGSSAKLVLYPHFADQHHMDFVDPYQFESNIASGAGGDFPTRIYQVTRLNIGKYSLTDLDTEVIMREAGAFGSSTSDGIIGSGALGLFDAVFLDYGNSRLILER